MVFFASSRGPEADHWFRWQIAESLPYAHLCLPVPAILDTGGISGVAQAKLDPEMDRFDPCAGRTTHLRRQDRPPPQEARWHHLPWFFFDRPKMAPSEADRRLVSILSSALASEETEAQEE